MAVEKAGCHSVTAEPRLLNVRRELNKRNECVTLEHLKHRVQFHAALPLVHKKVF